MVTVVDLLPEGPRRWSICPRRAQTVAAVPTFRRRVRSADRPSFEPCRRRWSIGWTICGRLPRSAVVASDYAVLHLILRVRMITRVFVRQCGRCARWLESGGGGSTTVDVSRQTVVDAPTRLADEMSAERPASGPLRGASTTVTATAGPIRRWADPTLGRSGAGRSGAGRSGAGPIRRPPTGIQTPRSESSILGSYRDGACCPLSRIQPTDITRSMRNSAQVRCPTARSGARLAPSRTAR